MAGHLADRPRVVSVIGEPGIRSVPVGEQRRPGVHDHVTAAEHRASRNQTFQVWAQICSLGWQ
jgi:hypothetical protein